jgi:hypothetical protein
VKSNLFNLKENVKEYKRTIIDKLIRNDDLTKLHNVILNSENSIEFYIFNDSFTDSFLNEIEIYSHLEKANGHKNISIFCSSKCNQLINYLVDAKEYVLELGYFRWHSFHEPLAECNVSETIEFKIGPIEMDNDNLIAKIKRDFLDPYRQVYSEELIRKYISDLQIAFKQPYIHAIKNGKIVAYLIDESYYESRLLLGYCLISFIWIDRVILNKEERSFISNNFFNHLKKHTPPYGALVNATNNISRKYFEKNGFVPNWIRAELRNA